jgi:outer membrane protein assembly factor BamB
MSQCKNPVAVLVGVALLGTGAGIAGHRYRAADPSGPQTLTAAQPGPTEAAAAIPAGPDDEKKKKEQDMPPRATSPDGKVVAVAKDKGVSLFDEASGKELRRLGVHRDKVTALAFSPDGKNLVSGGADGMTYMWDVATGKILWKFKGEDTVSGLKFSKDGRTITFQEGVVGD